MGKFIRYFKDHTEIFFLVFVTLVSVLSFTFFFREGVTTIYGDSKGHLNITRLVVDSPTPGASQLGAYWLPFLHILTLPFIGSNYLWHTGIAGTIPNMVSYIVTALFLYKLLLLLTKKKFTALILSSLYFLNPNILFMQTTPMTEIVFVMTFVTGSYYFILWSYKKELYQLIVSAVFILLSSITRYEGWGVVAFSSFILMFEVFRHKFSKKSEANFLIFSGLAWYGIFLWIVWGAIIVHDPLDFMRNSLSAKSQTVLYYSNLKATGDHNVPLAVATNIMAATHTSGYVLVSLFCVSFIYFIIKKNFKLFQLKNLAPMILLMPFLFDILTVYTGNVPVEVPELSRQMSPGNLFNVRYSIFLIPAMVAYLALLTKNKYAQTVFVVAVLVSYAFLVSPNYRNLVTLSESGASGVNHQMKSDLSWLRRNYDGGYILASTGAADGFMFESGFNLKNFISEGSYRLWDMSLEHPENVVRWVILDEGNLRDAVNKKINKRNLHKYFKPALKDNTFTIYKRNYSL